MYTRIRTATSVRQHYHKKQRSDLCNNAARNVSYHAVQLPPCGCATHSAHGSDCASRHANARSCQKQSSMRCVCKGTIPLARSRRSSIRSGPDAASRGLWRDLVRSHHAACRDHRKTITTVLSLPLPSPYKRNDNWNCQLEKTRLPVCFCVGRATIAVDPVVD